MNARSVSLVLAVAGLAAASVPATVGVADAQIFSQGANNGPPGYYRTPAPDDDDLAPLPAPGPYGRPSGYPPGSIQRDALPPPGTQGGGYPPPAPYGAPGPYASPGYSAPGPYGGQPYPGQPYPPQGPYGNNGPSYGAPNPYGSPNPYGGPGQRAAPAPYQEGALPPPGRGYSYGAWEPVRPPGDVAPGSMGPGGPINLGPPGQAGRPYDYGDRGPADAAPPPGGQNGYAALPPDYQPESGQPKELPPQFRRQIVDYPTREPAGTIIIDTPSTHLYLVLGGGKAMRYGIGVGREGFTWSGREKISKMAEWPDWHPPKEMIDRQPYLPRFMAGGESNPLGARALYLGNTLYRIHGTNQPSTIGSFVSSGCIRLTNNDIEDLYGRVTVGTKVLVLPGKQDTTASVR